MGFPVKLWSKGWDLDEEIEGYTVGDDPEIDLALVPYDCEASFVHARVLQKAGVLTSDEVDRLAGASSFPPKEESMVQGTDPGSAPLPPLPHPKGHGS